VVGRGRREEGGGRREEGRESMTLLIIKRVLWRRGSICINATVNNPPSLPSSPFPALPPEASPLLLAAGSEEVSSGSRARETISTRGRGRS
jgi:hypothetical protein